MSHLLQILTTHFTPFHKMLGDLSTIADDAWPEGGMVWNVDYLHGSAHTVKIDNAYVARSKGTYQEVSLQKHIHLWAKLISRAHGDHGDLVNIAGGPEWEIEENRIIAKYDDQAQQVITLFGASGADMVCMSFIDDAVHLSAKCVSLFGKHALVHNVFWSVD